MNCVDDSAQDYTTKTTADQGCAAYAAGNTPSKSICWASSYKNDGTNSQGTVCAGCVDSEAAVTAKDDGCTDAAKICTASGSLTGSDVVVVDDTSAGDGTNKYGDTCKACIQKPSKVLTLAQGAGESDHGCTDRTSDDTASVCDNKDPGACHVCVDSVNTVRDTRNTA